MLIKDLSNSFNPYPKKIQKKSKRNAQKREEEFCIMPKSKLYSTKRTEIYCERHEVYFSKAYRQKSINDGLIVFLMRKDHRGTNGVHGKNGDKLKQAIKKNSTKSLVQILQQNKRRIY